MGGQRVAGEQGFVITAQAGMETQQAVLEPDVRPGQLDVGVKLQARGTGGTVHS